MDEVEPAFDGKGDAPGLISHSSPLQEIGEIETSFTTEQRGHAWEVTLGTPEHVTMHTALFSGSSGPQVDTVIYLYEQQPGGGWGRYIRKNDNTGNTKWSRIEEDLEPGVYRVVVWARKASVTGKFAINFGCEDGVCEWVDPNNPDPEEPGTGIADQPGTGEVSFEVPLMSEETGQLLSTFNTQLAAAGLPTFPDHVTVSSASTTPDVEFDSFVSQAQRAAVLAITGSELMRFSDPGLYMARDFCYRGDASALAAYTAGFSDGIFSDQYLVHGWRAGTRSAYLEWKEPTEATGLRPDWTEYDATSTDVLIVFSTADDGEHEFASVPRCGG